MKKCAHLLKSPIRLASMTGVRISENNILKGPYFSTEVLRDVSLKYFSALKYLIYKLYLHIVILLPFGDPKRVKYYIVG